LDCGDCHTGAEREKEKTIKTQWGLVGAGVLVHGGVGSAGVVLSGMKKRKEKDVTLLSLVGRGFLSSRGISK